MIVKKIEDSFLNYYASIFNPFLSNYKNEKIILDLSAANFIDPFGILFLKIYLSALLNRRNEITIIFPEDEGLLNYLDRMNFPKFFIDQQQITFVPEIRNLQIFRTNLQDTLIELKEFIVNNDDEVERVVEQILEIAGNRIDYYKEIQEGLILALSESISNVEVHSQVNKAIVTLQSYKDREGQKIIIAIGDEGIGIRRGLGVVGEGLSDEDAIEKALEPEVTSRHGRGGMGLTEIKDYIIENNDTFGVRSGSGYLYIKEGNIKKGTCTYLPGTQLFFYLTAY